MSCLCTLSDIRAGQACAECMNPPPMSPEAIASFGRRTYSWDLPLSFEGRRMVELSERMARAASRKLNAIFIEALKEKPMTTPITLKQLEDLHNEIRKCDGERRARMIANLTAGGLAADKAERLADGLIAVSRGEASIHAGPPLPHGEFVIVRRVP